MTAPRTLLGRRVSRRVAVLVLVLAAGLALFLALGERATAPSTATTFSEYARIKTWYTPAFASNNAYVHFKTVDPEGYTVMEVAGSDLINLKQETYYMNQTPKRRNLVDTLRGKMQDDGWTEFGVDGDWYEYTFGR